MLDDIFNKFNFVSESKVENGQIAMNHSLGMSCIPQLGQYGDEYQWLQPCLAIKSLAGDKEHMRSLVYKLLPINFVEFQDSHEN